MQNCHLFPPCSLLALEDLSVFIGGEGEWIGTWRQGHVRGQCVHPISPPFRMLLLEENEKRERKRLFLEFLLCATPCQAFSMWGHLTFMHLQSRAE